MRSYRMGVLLSVCLLAIPGSSQQTTSSQPSQPQSAAPQDPQAVSVLNQALAASGGAAAIKAIADFTATGDVTYYWNPETHGSVTIQGLGVSKSRLDATLSTGSYSESVHDGQTSRKDGNGTLWQYPPAYPVPTSDAFSYQPPLFPSGLVIPAMQFATIVNNPQYAVLYKGVVQVNGASAYDILVSLIMQDQAQRPDTSGYQSVEYFIDNNTLHLIAEEDTIPNNIVHQIQYAKYTLANGILVPFSIVEETGGQKTRDIELSNVAFNTGLQDSAFILQ